MYCRSDNKHHLTQYRDNSTSVTASYIRGYPSYSHTTRPRVAKSSAGHAPVKCIGCISPRSRSSRPPFSCTDTLVPLTVHTLLRAFVCWTLPLFWDQLPLGYDFFSPLLSLFLSRHLFLHASPHRPLPSLGRTPGRVVLRVLSLSSISLLRADDR